VERVGVLLVTGKGGVGKTTVAAATAVHCAALSERTLVVSTDAAHSLGDVFGEPIGSQPTRIGVNLWAQQVDGRLEAETAWEAIRDYLAELLDWAGADGLVADELLVVPGMQEIFALENLLTRIEGGEFDHVIVDCAPTAETLRLLELPDALRWYVDKVFPSHRRVARMTRPLLRRTVTMPLADTAVFDSCTALLGRLQRVRRLLSDPGLSSTRLVLTPERVVLDETRRLFAYLSLFGYQVDSVIVNRLLPDDAGCTSLLQQWRQRQQDVLAAALDTFGELRLRPLDQRGPEPVGLPELASLGQRLYGDDHPMARPDATAPVRFELGDDRTRIVLRLPGFDPSTVRVGRQRTDLIVTAGSERRVLALPDSMVGIPTRGWRYDGSELSIEFGTATS
jgi:arsenite/tail-anchored protein-transporting ATPase